MEFNNQIIPIRTAGDEPPLFIPHDGAGEVLYAQLLAEHIAPEIPVYVLPPVAPDSMQLRTVEAMAAGMVRAIRNVQPRGPYRIAGWHAAGILAYEIAMQLIGADETVQFLGLINTDVPGIPEPMPSAPSDQQHKPDLATRYYLPQSIPIPVHIFAATEYVERWRSLLSDGLFRHWNAGNDNSPLQSSIVEELGHNLSEAIRGRAVIPAESLNDSYSPVITLQTGSHNRLPLFCVPGAGASVTAFLDLIQYLDAGCQVYGLQPRGLEGALVPHTSVNAAAEFYLKRINEISRKPVHLLGHSLGGWIVLEMALRLLAAGRTVASLTILDSEVPGQEAIQDYSNTDITMDWLQTFEHDLGRPLRIQRSDLEGRNEDEQLKLIHRWLVFEGLRPRQSGPETLRGPLRTFAAGFRATYKPTQFYPEPLRLVLAADKQMSRSRRGSQPDNIPGAWRRWAPKLICNQVPGNHTTMLKSPNVKILAKLIQDERYMHGIE